MRVSSGLAATVNDMHIAHSFPSSSVDYVKHRKVLVVITIEG